MASGQSSFAKNYDKLLLALALILLGVSVASWFSARNSAVAGKADCDRALAQRKPRHPKMDQAAAEESILPYYAALGAFDSPFNLDVGENSKNGFFVPEVRVWCVECRKPIPLESRKCPLCGKEQPTKKEVRDDPSTDSDGDGLPDIWERKYGLNPFDPSDAALDSDGDTFSNTEEFVASTDPANPQSHPDTFAYLRVESIEAARLPLLFRAESHMGGGNYKCQFNYFDKELGKTKSLFVKVGEPIGPLDRLPGAPMNAPQRYSDFRLAALDWREETMFSKIENREKTVKVPVAIVERISTGRKIEFRKEKESTDSTYVINIVQTRDGTHYVADGSEGEAEFLIGKDAFVLKSVDTDGRKIVITKKKDGKDFSVPALE